MRFHHFTFNGHNRNGIAYQRRMALLNGKRYPMGGNIVYRKRDNAIT